MEYESVTLFESPTYDTACIGISEDERAVYDYDLMVQHLMEKDGMTSEEAEDFICYNTIRALPIFANRPDSVLWFGTIVDTSGGRDFDTGNEIEFFAEDVEEEYEFRDNLQLVWFHLP